MLDLHGIKVRKDAAALGVTHSGLETVGIVIPNSIEVESIARKELIKVEILEDIAAIEVVAEFHAISTALFFEHSLANCIRLETQEVLHQSRPEWEMSVQHSHLAGV